MSSKTPSGLTKFNHLVTGSGGLNGMLEHARALGQLREQLARQLPADLNEGWQLARLDRELMVVTVDSPARATRLRYGQAALLHAALAATGTRPRTLKVKVAPAVRKPRPGERRELSAEVGELLSSTAASVEDPRLRRALLKLARHAKRD